MHRRPNGLAFTPNLQQLWVADSTIRNPSWTAYDIRGGRSDPASYSSYAGSKAAVVLNSATLGVVLGRTDGAAHLTGGEGKKDPTIIIHVLLRTKLLGFCWIQCTSLFLIACHLLSSFVFLGLSDGFKIDERGYIWTSIPNGFAVIDPGKREVVCQILLGTNTANIAFGRNGDV